MPDLDLSHRREELAHLGDLDVPRQVLHEDLHLGVDAGRVRLALLEAPAASASRGTPAASGRASAGPATASGGTAPPSVHFKLAKGLQKVPSVRLHSYRRMATLVALEF